MNIALIIAIVLGAIVALGLGGLVFLARKSKAGAPPGLVDGTLTPCPDAPNCVVSEAHADEKHRAEPLPRSAWEEIPNAVGNLGGSVTTIRDDYIAATFSSKLFGFVDDVEFRKAGDAVHVRSASRVGYSDQGANKERVAALRNALAR